MKTTNRWFGGALGVGLAWAMAAAGYAAEGSKESKPARPEAAPYPLKVCAVNGKKLNKDATKQYAFNYEGQQVKLCCEGCLDKFNKKPTVYLEKISQANARSRRAFLESGWTLEGDNGVFALGDAPSSAGARQ